MNDLKSKVLKALEDIKAKEVNTMEVSKLTSITDHMIIATGTSIRHVKAIADSIVKTAKDQLAPPLGVEGEKNSEWILIDLGNIIVHVMLNNTREFYALDKMWDMPAPAANQLAS